VEQCIRCNDRTQHNCFQSLANRAHNVVVTHSCCGTQWAVSSSSSWHCCPACYQCVVSGCTSFNYMRCSSRFNLCTAMHSPYCILYCVQVRELFASAAAAAPCIVFIDEVDAITAKRETRYITPLLIYFCLICYTLRLL
jgi:ATPase family associated with various cellular activities (AAA)